MAYFYIAFNGNFLEKENLIQKPEYDFLVESTAMENAAFSNKTANLRQIERGVKNGPKCSSAWVP